MFQVYDMRTLREIRLMYGDDAKITAGSLLELKWWREAGELFAQPDVKAILHGSWCDGGFFHAGDLLDWFDAKRGM